MGEPGSLHIAESHTYISDDSAASSDVDYNDDSTLHEVNVEFMYFWRENVHIFF